MPIIYQWLLENNLFLNIEKTFIRIKNSARRDWQLLIQTTYVKLSFYLKSFCEILKNKFFSIIDITFDTCEVFPTLNIQTTVNIVYCTYVTVKVRNRLKSTIATSFKDV